MVDVDVKDNRNGRASLEELRIIDGLELSPTLRIRTVSGGDHYIYFSPEGAPVADSVDRVANGVDVRGWHGYCATVGSVVGDLAYEVIDDLPIAQAPAWVIERAGAPARTDPASRQGPPENLDVESARHRATFFLRNARPAVEGEGGDERTYRTACRVRDYGLSQDDTLELMLEHYNPRCEPPWDEAELAVKINNAYSYARGRQGGASAAAHFTRVEPEPGSAAGGDDDPPEARTPPPDDFDGDDDPPDYPEDDGVPGPEEAREQDETNEGRGRPPMSVHQLNRSFAWIASMGTILWETTDNRGQRSVCYLAPEKLKGWLANRRGSTGDERMDAYTMWLRDEARRGYRRVGFLPGREAPQGVYNLWNGFTVQPAPAGAVPPPHVRDALDAYWLHMRENTCGGDAKLAHYLTGWIAHMFQKPDEKPLVSPIFRGGKGVGKTTLIDRLGALLGRYYVSVANPRFLVGNFNHHLEGKLLLALEEAHATDDKTADGVIKHLVTHSTIEIERKGVDSYSVENFLRIVKISNEHRVARTTPDERRYAVFEVKMCTHKMRTPAEIAVKDAWFRDMRLGLEDGGYSYLLRDLLAFPLDDFNVNAAPWTEGLAKQKKHNLTLVQEWLYESLREGMPWGLNFENGWPREVEKARIYEALDKYRKIRGLSRVPAPNQVGRDFREACPAILVDQKRRDGERLVPVYRFPPLDVARAAWCEFMNVQEEWPPEPASAGSGANAEDDEV